jgi:hypothetical protein
MGSSVRAKDVADGGEPGDSPQSLLRARRISQHSEGGSRRSQHLLNPVIEQARYASIRALLRDFCAR